ncbi:hypothetical protein Fsol_00730 [Candidatus Fokinia solitaria]|uniref:Uncharacterized protein n=1 Tax=Candidatus Fokinia solitaria TaxID=1802984 RepID=A0A2U8BT14_9RICK|nr:hypothetical protein [Candidatus Fokinia solitaria]AWD33506.1 hypothetical protein Fsol_00730 [Candidatus Fokinia solitaria]
MYVVGLLLLLLLPFNAVSAISIQDSLSEVRKNFAFGGGIVNFTPAIELDNNLKYTTATRTRDSEIEQVTNDYVASPGLTFGVGRMFGSLGAFIGIDFFNNEVESEALTFAKQLSVNSFTTSIGVNKYFGQRKIKPFVGVTIGILDQTYEISGIKVMDSSGKITDITAKAIDNGWNAPSGEDVSFVVSALGQTEYVNATSVCSGISSASGTCTSTAGTISYSSPSNTCTPASAVQGCAIGSVSTPSTCWSDNGSTTEYCTGAGCGAFFTTQPTCTYSASGCISGEYGAVAFSGNETVVQESIADYVEEKITTPDDLRIVTALTGGFATKFGNIQLEIFGTINATSPITFSSDNQYVSPGAKLSRSTNTVSVNAVPAQYTYAPSSGSCEIADCSELNNTNTKEAVFSNVGTTPMQGNSNGYSYYVYEGSNNQYAQYQATYNDTVRMKVDGQTAHQVSYTFGIRALAMF